MGKIDTSNWGEFRIGDLFEIHPTKTYKMTNKKLLDNGNSPVVVNSSYNNGIGGMSTQPTTENGNMITFSDTVDANTIFYQEYPFIGYSHVQGLYPIGKYKNNWTKYTLQFFMSVFRKKALSMGFDYGNKFRRDIAVNLTIKLPIDSEGNPDWAYMESYMSNIKTTVSDSLTKLQSAKDSHNHKINTTDWESFRIGDLFDAYLSKDDIQPKNIKEGDVPLISSGKENNGIVAFISNDNAKLWNEKTITVDMFGKAFYQNKPYYCVSHGRVNILVPKFKITDNIGKYLTCVIESVTINKYKFTEMCTGKKLTADTIKLPVDSKGEPDWDYMEQYMKNIEEKVKKTVNSLEE